jgi:asparagine synthase (glutamine-hydrolysing)
VCGIAGFLCLDGGGYDDYLARARDMAGALDHRGPDDAGVWVDQRAGVALGHRRLAILDLSANGHQPMVSSSGRYVVTYNGELYNFRALRSDLDGSIRVEWRGHSDTEVLLAALDRWGLEATLPRLNGMFAFALWDRATRRLHLVRDRMGEKPLYFGWFGRTLLFGSELKALKNHPAFTARIDRHALALYLRHNCVPAPYSIYEGVWKLPPAVVTTIRADREPERPPRFEPYWSLHNVAEGAHTRSQDLPSLVDQFEEILEDAVLLRLESDVPLGAFLSGGIDSSAVVALMQRQSSLPVRTFTIGFDDPAYDESNAAAAVARHLGTEHLELRLTPKETLDVVPRLSGIWDEPFADSSQIPTVLISELTRQHVSVSLSGDGGDELFGGYNRYVWCPSIWHRVRTLPLSLRRTAAAAARKVPQRTWDSIFDLIRPILPDRFDVRVPGLKLHKLAEVLPAADIMGMYRTLTSHWADPSLVALGGHEPLTSLTDPGAWPQLENPVSLMMYLDAVTYLPDDILVKVDRASMSVGLEARVPFLDHRVVEFAWSIPLQYKLHAGQGKWIVRQVLARHVPAALTERPKMGFGLPLGDWLRGPLREWGEELLGEERLRREGYFDPAPIRRLWVEHVSGRGEWPFHLWDVLMFQAWLSGQR